VQQQKQMHYRRGRWAHPCRCPSSAQSGAITAAIVVVCRRSPPRPPVWHRPDSVKRCAVHAGRPGGRHEQAAVVGWHPSSPSYHGTVGCTCALCQKRQQRRQRGGNLQVATRCDEERQLKHLPRHSSGMRLGTFEYTSILPNHLEAQRLAPSASRAHLELRSGTKSLQPPTARASDGLARAGRHHS
jgi:hypothetical protein